MTAQYPVPAIREPKQNGWRAVNIYLLTAAAFVVVVAGMRASAGILVPFLLAVFVAVICAPLYQAMTRRHVPASLAILGIVLVMLAAVLVMALLDGCDVGSQHWHTLPRTWYPRTRSRRPPTPVPRQAPCANQAPPPPLRGRMGGGSCNALRAACARRSRP